MQSSERKAMNATETNATTDHAPLILATLSATEKISLLTLSLHNLLEGAGLQDLARIAWCVYLEASVTTDELGTALGLME